MVQVGSLLGSDTEKLTYSILVSLFLPLSLRVTVYHPFSSKFTNIQSSITTLQPFCAIAGMKHSKRHVGKLTASLSLPLVRCQRLKKTSTAVQHPCREEGVLQTEYLRSVRKREQVISPLPSIRQLKNQCQKCFQIITIQMQRHIRETVLITQRFDNFPCSINILVVLLVNVFHHYTLWASKKT